MRCVNIDWLEVYVEESNERYPCNADYYRRRGYMVDEREYGTRIYAEMFVIEDGHGNPMIEIRRNPKSADSSFTGLSQFSSHIRLSNWVCYQDNAVQIMRDFLIQNDYIFHRIFRIDICYDFEKFDTGDIPAKVARRIIEKVYLKMNQGRIAAHGADNWSTYEWESLSWGSPTSMVSTKMYNKSKELKAMGDHKPYIYSAWMMAGLIDNPLTLVKRSKDGTQYKPEIWRIEFSMHSKADRWLVIEDISGKKVKKKAVEHSLTLFDAKDKLWQRFQDLTYHYFRFKILSYKGLKRGAADYALSKVKSDCEREIQRKDRMPDKVLFYFDRDHQFQALSAVPKPSKPSHADDILLRRLIQFREEHPDPKLRQACTILIDTIDTRELYRFTSEMSVWQVKALQAAIALKMGGDERDAVEIIAQLEEAFKNQEIW